MIKTLRNIVLFIWICTVCALGYWISQHSDSIDPYHLFVYFQSFGSYALIVYVGVSLFRGLLLLPSLPLVLVGVLFFPNNTHVIFLISMLGIIFSGILIYYFSDMMGLDDIFREHTTNTKIQKSIDKFGFYAVMLWSFLPVVPTDLICYAAGTVRMNFWKFVGALTLGEGCIVAMIVYGGREMVAILGI